MELNARTPILHHKNGISKRADGVLSLVSMQIFMYVRIMAQQRNETYTLSQFEPDPA